MDRRSFIKLTAVTGTGAALASCGNPENELIRFIPAENIVPGVAVWKPGVCTLCSAGCGLTVRVMDADADVIREGQAGVVRIAAAKKLEGAPDHPDLAHPTHRRTYTPSRVERFNTISLWDSVLNASGGRHGA